MPEKRIKMPNITKIAMQCLLVALVQLMVNDCKSEAT